MKKRNQRTQRGFVLIVVVVLAAVAIAIALGTLVASGRAKSAAVRAKGADLAASIAESGLERAVAYAKAAVGSDADFDLVLDPDGAANCTGHITLVGDGKIPETGNMDLPKFTEAAASTVTLPAPWSKRFKEVPLDGGAYFVRFDDDNDDGIPAAQLANPTQTDNNHPANACVEGLVALGTGADNAARDRNGQMWITVIGIFPGTDILSATHRTVLRKLLVNPNTGGGTAAFAVGGEIDATPSGSIQACSEVAGIGSSDDIKGSVCTCKSSTSGTNNNSTTDCGAACPSCSAPAATVQKNVPLATPTVKPADDASWFDWKSSCNFYMKHDDGLYYWDAQGTGRTAPAVDCASYAGNLVKPDKHVNNQGSCWIPLVTVAGPSLNADPWGKFGAEIDVAAGTFHPKAGGQPAFPDGGAYFIGGAIQVNEPDWDADCPKGGAPSDFTWTPTPGPNTPAPHCGANCNGSNDVLKIVPGGGNATFQFQNVNLAAYPTAVFYVDEDFALPGNCCFTGSKPTTQLPASNWPMITLIVKNNFTIDNPNKELWLGVGTKAGGLYPSLVVGHDFHAGPSNIEFALAGGLYVGNNFDLKNEGINLFGPVQIVGDLSVGPGAPSKINWTYDVDLLGTGGGTPSAPLRLTVPMGL